MRYIVIVAAIGLAACGSEAPVAEQPDQVETVDPAWVEQEGNAFPTAFEGGWGITPEECAKGFGTTETYVEIKGDRLDFGDRTGKITAMKVDKPGRLTTEIDFSGQGRDWQRSTKFYLEKDGAQLGRSDIAPVIFNVNYMRCEKR